MILIPAQKLLAQDSSGARQEGWPEVNLFYKIDDKLRLHATYSTTRLRNSDYTDGGAGFYLDFFAFGGLRKKFNIPIRDTARGYYLWLRGGYYYSVTPPGSKDPVTENTIVTEANSRFHLPYDILLTNKNRFDWRIINGDFNPRYRARFTFDKDMRTQYLYFNTYFYGEYFANLNLGNSNRFRLCIGEELKVASHINFESYFLYQFKNGNNVDELNAIGMVLKFYLDHQELKQKFSKKKSK